ncbi:uncharacterized protein BDZ99DRAFT_494675 [Mytilinidion resinicola]|uniref:F-box domain-containing protein n=1 Tax=Mytilinidion resinicola TaxID=574789 RepID=A0A6A6Z0S0_9PEZI|nr:uncharacterized protein BDZ99DRAFT_494675 [Mytilinidion resinicola]KAF2814762.1 hypothetical protein BDZ99DRAFT_494675 [Mytilinidion resinicola]
MGASTTPSTPISRRGLPVTPKSKLRTPGSRTVSPKTGSPRKSESPVSIKQARRNFIEHLEIWSLNRRANCSFSGKISPQAPDWRSEKPYALGEPVICELLPHGETAPIIIVVRLFPLLNQFKYRMTIRCGSGWEDERTWFLRQHRKYQTRAQNRNRCGSVTRRRPRLASDEFPVTVRPLFNKFTLLPIELQQWIFELAMGNGEEVKPHSSRQSRAVGRPVDDVSIAKLLTLSRSINCHITPWFFRTTTFHFGTQHLTTFLRQIGPINRSELRKLSFSFGRYALIHVLRFFTPNQVFELFNPLLTPQQHFWRVLLQDSMRELNLAVLTIKVDHIIKRDVSAIEKSLVTSFGSVGRVKFEKMGMQIEAASYRGGKEFEKKTWYQHTQDIFERYCQGRESDKIFGKAQLKGTIEDLETKMQDDLEFFHT